MAPYSEYFAHAVQKGPLLCERKGETTLKARMHINGKDVYWNTETADLALATWRAR